MFCFNQKYQVGLSFHSDEIRLLKLHRSKHSLSIVAFAIVQLTQAVPQAQQTTPAEQVIQAVAALVRQTHSAGCVATLVLPSGQVMIKQVSLPTYLSDQECLLEFMSNREVYLPGIKQHLNIDYVRSKQAEEENRLIAAKTDQVNGYVYAARQAGLFVQAVDINLYTLSRLYSIASALPESIMILDIDGGIAHLIILRGNRVVFHEYFAYGLHPGSSPSDFCQRVHYAIQGAIVSKKIDDTHPIYLSGSKASVRQIKALLQQTQSIKTSDYPLCHHIPFIGSDTQQHAFDQLPSLLIPCGAALREIRWQ